MANIQWSNVQTIIINKKNSPNNSRFNYGQIGPCFSRNLVCHFIKSIIHLVFQTKFYQLFLLHVFILLEHIKMCMLSLGYLFQYYGVIVLSSKASQKEKKKETKETRKEKLLWWYCEFRRGKKVRNEVLTLMG